MNNEPVAWIKKKEIGYMEVTKRCGAKDYATNLGLVPEDDDDVPLYTHPAKILTEDEIREVADSVCHTWKKNGVGELYMEDFARAILRKAQEK